MCNCPYCKVELKYIYGFCGGDDPECDCDEAFECPKCLKRFIKSCPAHKDDTWEGYENLKE